jgi:hypothetical protein
LLDDLGDRRGYSYLKEEALESGGIVLEEAVDLSYDRLLMNDCVYKIHVLLFKVGV